MTKKKLVFWSIVGIIFVTSSFLLNHFLWEWKLKWNIVVSILKLVGYFGIIMIIHDIKKEKRNE